jgi:hypothetical protein
MLLDLPVIANSVRERVDGALLLAETFLKLDPGNSQVKDLVKTIQAYKKVAEGGE